MKEADLIRKLEEAGCEFVRHGANHDWYRNPKTGTSQPVPATASQRVFGKTHPEETRELNDFGFRATSGVERSGRRRRYE